MGVREQPHAPAALPTKQKDGWTEYFLSVPEIVQRKSPWTSSPQINHYSDCTSTE